MINNDTKLIILRGPSGSGKSSVARAARSSQGNRMALIEQDYLRRVLLREHDIPGGLNIELIKRTVIFALENSFDVILEGIFDSGRYGKMLEELTWEHPKNNHFFYFYISFDETFRRHQSKPNRDEFGEKEMRSWYKGKDLLSFAKEVIVNEKNTLEETRDLILSTCNIIPK